MSALRVIGSSCAGTSSSSRPFEDRTAAGRQIAKALESHRASDTLVLGVSRRGMEVADALAQALALDLDVLAARKLRAPQQSEPAIGAAAEGGVVYWNEEVIDRLGIGEDERRRVLADAQHELAPQLRNYRYILPRARIRGRRIILTDDGVVTGTTLHAAIEAVLEAGPSLLVIALAGGPRRTLEEITAVPGVDELHALVAPDALGEVAELYESSPPVSEHWVCHILRAARERMRSRRVHARHTKDRDVA